MRVGFKSACANLVEPTRNIDQLSALRRPAGLKFVVKPLVAKIPFVVRDPLLQAAMGLDDEFRHKSLQRGLICDALYFPRQRRCGRVKRPAWGSYCDDIRIDAMNSGSKHHRRNRL